MLEIVLLSDTHSYCDKNLDIHLSKADEIWHAGDFGNLEVVEWLESFQKPFRGVYGNIDGQEIRYKFSEDTIFTIEGIRVYMTHIGGHPGRYNSRVRDKFLEIKADLFICGHSHILKMVQDPKYKHWVFNPGAAGKVGFHHVRTALKFNLDQRNITKVEIINLGPK